MSAIKQLSFIVIFSVSFICQGTEAPPFNTVQNLFSAMSAFDYKKMRVVSTTDFQLLEDGEVWTIDDLIHAIKPNGKTYKRRNYFCVVKSVIRDDTAWISYWNKASFSAADKTSEVAWLESAVLQTLLTNDKSSPAL